MANEYTLSINDVLKDTLVDLPGVVRSVAQREMRLTLREFFEKSFAWTANVTGISVPTGEEGIQVDDDDENTEVIGILNVAIGNADEGFVDLRPLTERPINEETTSTLPEFWYVNSNPDEFTLYPYLDTPVTDTLTVKVALMPALDVAADDETLPRQITLKYYDAILNGFLARMYAHPNKPYSAPVFSQQLRHNFLRAIGYYAAQRKAGYNGSPSWNYPRGWK